MRGFREAWWLAKWEIRRSKLSLLATALFTLVLGLVFVGPVIDATLRGKLFSAFVVDFVFLALFANLAINWTSTGYFFVGQDAFSKRLSFLRSLPVSARDIVSGRALIMVLTLLVMSPIAFLPPYLLSGAVREELGPVGYPCFAILWAMYGIVSGCLNAYLELGGRARTMLLTHGAWVLVLVLFVALATASGTHLVAGSAQFARTHGPVAAMVALAVGSAALLSWSRLMERRLRRRDLSA